MIACLKSLHRDIKNNWKKREPTLYFVYYAGHGVMRNNETHAVLGMEKNSKKAVFNLEGHLRALSKETGGCIIAVMACCRERFDTRGVGETATYEDLEGDT